MQQKPKGKLDLEGYIELLDRMLEREGFASAERDEIFNYPENISIISDAFKKYMHPRYVLKELNREPVRAMYVVEEGMKKFKKVMGEFGKGKLKPYRSKTSLKSKKQGGSKKDLNRALAIAYSEAGMTNESVNETNLTPAQEYAVKLMQTIDIKLISSPLQLKKGTLIFKDDETDIQWQISKRGYLRKLSPLPKNTPWRYESQWQVVYQTFPGSYDGKIQYIDEEQYKELAKLLYEKIRKSKNKKPFKESYVRYIYSSIYNVIQDAKERGYTNEEIKETITRLYKKYVENK